MGRPGPRTPDGKQRTKYNAIRHSIFADIVFKGDALKESEDDYRRLLDGLRDAFQPANALEEVLVEDLAFAFLRRSRVYKAEGHVVPLLFERVGDACTKDTCLLVPEKEREVASPELVFRYDTSLDRQIERKLNQLERLRRIRLGQPVPPR